MSSKRNQRRAKQARRTNVRSAQRSKRPPTPADIALRLVRDLREPLTTGDRLDAELAAASLQATGYEQVFDLETVEEQQAAPHPAVPVISLLRNLQLEPGELLDAALALALALCEADRDDPQVAAAGGVLVAQLREAGATDPQWPARIGSYDLGAMHDMRDAWGDHHQLFIDLHEPGAADVHHSLAVEIDGTDGFQIVDIEVLESSAELLEDVRSSIADASDVEQGLTVLESISPARCGDLLRSGVQAVFADAGVALIEHESLDLLALALARLELFADVLDDPEHRDTRFTSPLDELDADALAAHVASHPAREGEPDATDAAIAVVTQFAVDNRAAFGTRFAPSDVAELLGEFLPNHPDQVLTADVKAVLAATRLWAAVSVDALGLADPLHQDIRRAITYYGLQYAQELGALPDLSGANA